MNSSRNRDITRFALKALLFFAPALCVIIPLEWKLWSSGETLPVNLVLERQARVPEAIWMRGLLDQSFADYKWAGLQRNKPEVVALGSSRVMKFRAAMFGMPPGHFYNAGGLVSSLGDLETYAKTVDRKSAPRVILLGLDMWWFNKDRPTHDDFSTRIHFDSALNWQAHLQLMRDMNSKNGKFLWSVKAHPDRIGLTALHRRSGFRADGSLESGLTPPADWKFLDREDPPVVKRVRKGEDRFEFTHGLSASRVQQLRRALRLLQDKGIYVLAFSPPLAADAVQMIESMPQQRDIWREFRATMPQVCAELQIPYVDASTTRRLSLDDRYMIDGLHAEETFQLHVLREWLKNPNVRKALPQTSAVVESALRSPRTNPWFADYKTPT